MTDFADQALLDDLESAPIAAFESLTNEDAVALGLAAVDLIRERSLNLAVDVVLHGDLVFRAKLGSTGPDNDPWLAGKAATARTYAAPSLLVRLRHEAEGAPFEERAVDGVTLRAAGGSVPLYVADELVGTLTLSGEPDTVDHATAVAALDVFTAARR
ncbi:hypothetical protein GCM10009819_31680 [Agromyces tropicus]|uniref:Heme-binding protein n=1 Tax=Agromyces tropicus TaxID=555371 RepID=A0ABN2UVU9_9MICO